MVPHGLKSLDVGTNLGSSGPGWAQIGKFSAQLQTLTRRLLPKQVRVQPPSPLRLPYFARSKTFPNNIALSMKFLQKTHQNGLLKHGMELGSTCRSFILDGVAALSPSTLALMIADEQHVCILLLVKNPSSANGRSSQKEMLLSRNFPKLHVYLPRCPTPIMKIHSPRVKQCQRITDHFLIALQTCS